MTPEQQAAIVALIRAGEPIPPEVARVLWRDYCYEFRVVNDVHVALEQWCLLAQRPGVGFGQIVAELAELAGMKP